MGGAGRSKAGWPAGAAMALAMLIPQTALADWRRGETAHFIVYSNGSERNLRDYAARLERFEGLLAQVAGNGQSSDGIRKLPVYLVENGRELRVVQPDLPEGIAGFYRASSNNIRAILVRGQDDDLLLHEYTHHHMSQTSPGSYPGWFREGYAEYFATATVDSRGRATIGYPDMGRLQQLQRERWLPIEQLLSASPATLERRGQRGAFYAQSWLLTHYLLSDQERQRRLDGYLRAMRDGADPVETLSSQFGMTPDQLERELRTYMQRGLRYSETTLPPLTPEITITPMPASADDLLLIGLRVMETPSPEDGPGLLAQVRALAARHPNDPLALTVLARAELAWGDAATGEAALAQVLAAEPDNGEALLMSARRRVETAEAATDDEAVATGLREAQRLLARAYAADPTDYRVLEALASLRRNASNYPTENDLNTWREAVAHAPQVLSLRGQAADAMLMAGLNDEAEFYLLPIANDPHAGGNAERARQRLETIRARRAEGAAEASTD